MKNFLLTCGVTCVNTTNKSTVRVTFSCPIKIDHGYPNKARQLKALKLLLHNDDLNKYLPTTVFGNWLLGKEHYVNDSLNIIDIKEITEAEFGFHFG